MTINGLASRVLPDRVWNSIKSVAGYRVFYRQEAELSSGVRLRVRDHPDWSVLTEVFLDGGYDGPILDAIRGADPSGPIRVLDLGANAGFFTLRVVDLVRRHAPGREVSVLAAEPGSKPGKKFEDRVLRENDLGDSVTLLRGLVGRRSGTAAFAEYPATTTNNVFDANATAATRAYVDLEAHLDGSPIDLLKCDIEGSEADFLASYPDLLARTRHLVIELHEAYVEYAACDAAIRAAGFERRTSHIAGPCRVDYWVRPAQAVPADAPPTDPT